ncbi:unnamed protein product [Linum trigynum]|uniref:Uncharacterized protein n=1 Tax=Linum trigynum TaxID=586398 RepID=A0AAV2DWM7_9ROSI
MNASSSSAGGGGSGESSQGVLRLLLARYQLEQMPLYLLHAPSSGLLPLDARQGHPLMGLHPIKALIICSYPGLVIGMVSRILLLKLELIVVELLILEMQLLELLSEVVLARDGNGSDRGRIIDI